MRRHWLAAKSCRCNSKKEMILILNPCGCFPEPSDVCQLSKAMGDRLFRTDQPRSFRIQTHVWLALITTGSSCLNPQSSFPSDAYRGTLGQETFLPFLSQSAILLGSCCILQLCLALASRPRQDRRKDNFCHVNCGCQASFQLGISGLAAGLVWASVVDRHASCCHRLRRTSEWLFRAHTMGMHKPTAACTNSAR